MNSCRSWPTPWRRSTRFVTGRGALQDAPTPRRQIQTIQYARAIVACLIVFWHTGGWRAELAHRQYYLYAFMMISGFVLSLPTSRRESGPLKYIVSKMARISPVYWLITIVIAIVICLIPNQRAHISASELILSLAFVPHYNSAHLMYPILIPGWYLTYDVVLVLLLGALCKVGHDTRFWLVNGALAGLVVLGVAFRPSDPIGYRLTDQILSAFIVGAMIQRVLSGRTMPRALALLLVVLGLALCGLGWSAPTAVSWPLLVSGLPVFIAMTGVIGLDRPNDRPLPWLRWIGDASMSIYLWHELGIAGAGMVLRRIGIAAPNFTMGLETMGGFALGAVMYPLLERPITRYLVGKVNAAFDGSKTVAGAAAPVAMLPR